MTQSIDNSEAVMQGVVRDPITGALLRVNADGSINVSGTGGLVGTGTTVTGGASITLNTAGIQFNGVALAGTATAMTNATATLNSAGLSLSIAAARAATDALGLNTAGTNITWTANSSGVSINAAGYAGTATTMAAGLSATLNSVGLNLSVGAYLTTGRASTDAIGLNTAFTNVTATVNSSGLSINAAGYAGTGTSLGSTAGTVPAMTLNSAGLSFLNPEPIISSFQNLPFNMNTGPALGGASASTVVAFLLPQAGSFGFIRMPVLMTTSSTAVVATAASANASAAVYSTWNAVVYSVGTGANSASLLSVASGQGLWTYMNSISLLANGSNMSITQSYCGNIAGVAFTSSTQYSSTDTVSYPFNSSYLQTVFSSVRFLDIPFSSSLSAGAYWLMVGYSSSSSTNSAVFTALTIPRVFYTNNYAVSNSNIQPAPMGATGTGTGGYMGAAAFSTVGGGTTNSFAFTNLFNTASSPLLLFQMIRSA